MMGRYAARPTIGQRAARGGAAVAAVLTGAAVIVASWVGYVVAVGVVWVMWP